MSETVPPPLKNCRQCGAELPDSGTNGLCPACLMAEAMKPTGPKARWEPPSAEELAKLLPQYEITRMLGRGGMGAVYQGTQKSLDRTVAIKILSNDLETADASFAERFKNEARAMAKLSHPGIVAVFDSGETANGLLYIVMEFIEGTDVSRMIAGQGRLHTEHAMAITAHVCDALAYAHERGIIHRDIKPANIMVGYDGVVKVADFGLAKMTQSQNSGLTQSGMAMGTLHYMAPEALMLGSAVDHRADIYAVGVMLYQMLTGKIPQGLFELPSLQVPGLDPRYDGIIGKALREDRELRYPSVLAMRHDLDAILTQPVVKVEAAAEKPPAALETQARPQRPGGPPQRIAKTQPQMRVRPEKKGSPLLWIAVVALAVLVVWLYFKKPAPEGEPSASVPAVGNPTVADKSPAPAVNESSAATTTSNPAEATKDRPFVNSLGMKFVPVPGTKVLFCIHETRYKDYAAYAKANAGVYAGWRDQTMDGFRPKNRPEDHPVTKTSWEDAQLFCKWLSQNEGKVYRLPSDREWSVAVGLGSKELPQDNETPERLSGKVKGQYPWGIEWPPPAGSGNFSDYHRKMEAPASNEETGYLSDYDDGFPTTSPVMSFAPNQFGLHDLDGNVREWVQEWYNGEQKSKVLRGGSWLDVEEAFLRASFRINRIISDRHVGAGFRCVLEVASLPSPTAKTPVPLPASGQPSSTAVAPAPTIAKAVSDPPNTTRRVTDLLARVDPVRDTLNGAWTRMADGLSLEGDGNMQIPFTPPQEYDFEVEFSISSDSVGVVAQQIRFEGKPITWIMSGQAPGFRPRFGFGPIDGIPSNGASEASTFADQRFTKGVRYRSMVRVRKDSLAGVLDGTEMVVWKADASRIPAMRIPTLKADRHLGFNAKDGTITFHKATITEFLPQAATPVLPTGPTTWTDTKGRSITATFKAIASGNVLLEIAGKVTPVPLNTLSAESQKLARAYHEQSESSALLGRNLIVNPGGEDDLPGADKGEKLQISGWSADGTQITVQKYNGWGVDDKGTGGVPPSYEFGKVYYYGGAQAPDGSESMTQTISLNALATQADLGEISYRASGSFGGYMNQPDTVELKIDFLDGSNGVMGSTSIGKPSATARDNKTGYIHDEKTGSLPPRTRLIRLSLTFFKQGRAASDGCADNLSLSLFRTASPKGGSGEEAVPDRPGNPPAATLPLDPAQATKDRPFVNSLGMKFVPVPGTKVLFCIHETRRVDFAAFAKTNPGVGGNWAIPVLDDKPLVGEPLDHHPVAKVSRTDAESFCKWLSSQSPHRYRLPTDAEWSIAVGFDEPRTAAETPDDLHKKAMSANAARIYPWGTDWPPPAKAGNYSGEFTPSTDTFPTTAPVMSFQANEYGLYDLGGNVWEWVSDRYWNKDLNSGTLRGLGWLPSREPGFRSGCRFGERQIEGNKQFGFRVVIELPDASTAPAP